MKTPNKINIEIRTNYNVLLWHFVDRLSKWNIFIGSHIKTYFEQNFIETKDDHDLLVKYAGLRKALDWGEDANLFKWSYEGFQDNPKYNHLLETIKHFESKENTQHILLKDLLKERLEVIVGLVPEIQKEIESTSLDKYADRLIGLLKPISTFEPGVISSISVYRPNSFNKSTSGGAMEMIYILKFLSRMM